MPQEEIQLWIDQLASSSILLQILRSDFADADEVAWRDAHLQREEAAMAERRALQEETRKLDAMAEFEARRGCGLRLDESHFWPYRCQPAVKQGDQVYVIPPLGSAAPPKVGIVHKVGRMGDYPTGSVDVLAWDLMEGGFSPVPRVPVRALELLPACCGRGNLCPLLHERMQWPNGDCMSATMLSQLEIMALQYSVHWDPRCKGTLGMAKRKRAAEARCQQTGQQQQTHSSHMQAIPSDCDLLDNYESDVSICSDEPD
jgi:hypothetical protein